MLVPAKRNFFDDFMMSPFDAFFDAPAASGKGTPGLMRTDIKQTDEAFDLAIELPGVAKEDVTAQIADGYLEISAETKRETEEADKKASYLRKERFEGKCTRKFYVGDEILEDEISAKFEDGVLKIHVPKRTEPLPEPKKSIAIA